MDSYFPLVPCQYPMNVLLSPSSLPHLFCHRLLSLQTDGHVIQYLSIYITYLLFYCATGLISCACKPKGKRNKSYTVCLLAIDCKVYVCYIFVWVWPKRKVHMGGDNKDLIFPLYYILLYYSNFIKWLFRMLKNAQCSSGGLPTVLHKL